MLQTEIKPETSILEWLPLIFCLLSTFYLVGLIWVIQLLHYPLFARVGQESFPAYHAEHTERIILALSLPVLVQMGSALALAATKPAVVPDWAVWLNLAFTFGFWLITAVMQIPEHGLLAGGFDEKVIQALVNGNWVRTLWWSAQGGLLTWLLLLALSKRI